MRTLCLTISLLAIAGCGPSSAPGSDLASIGGSCMGTTWSAILDIEGTGEDAEAVAAIVQAKLDAVNAAMSTWDPASDLSRLNRAPVGEPVEAAAITLEVMQLAEELFAATGGAFDPTVGPLVDLWGFKDTDIDRAGPTDDEIAAARARLGWETLAWDAPGLRRLREGVEVDLSAIAKGYAVDRAAAALADHGVQHFLLEVGGELVLKGLRKGRPWRVGVDDPGPPRALDWDDPEALVAMAVAPRRTLVVLEATDRAIATSGSYRNLRLVGGELVTHAIDPRTGAPIRHALVSVTVVAPTCAEADALATAALVLGPVDGLTLLEERPGVEGLLLVRRRDGDTFALDRVETSGMAPLLLP